MKQLIKYAALLFALLLSASIIGGCLTLGISLVQGLYDEFSYPEEMEGKNNSLWYRTEEGDVVFLGVRFGGDGEVKSGSEVFNGSDIESMDIEVGSGELIVEVWDSNSISVDYENIPEEYKIYNDNGTLVIEREDTVFFWGVSFTETPKIHISVPAEMVFDEIQVDKGSGSAKFIGLSVDDFNVDNGSGGLGISNVTAKKLSVDSGSGGVNISDTKAERSVFNSGSGALIVQDSQLGETSMDSGSGFVNFENVIARNLVLDTGSGRVDVSGVLTGNCFFESGSGSINVVIYGEENDYNFRTDMGSGSFYLNGRKEDGAELNVEYTNADHLLVFDAGSGRVSLEFKKAPDVTTEDVDSDVGEGYDR